MKRWLALLFVCAACAPKAPAPPAPPPKTPAGSAAASETPTAGTPLFEAPTAPTLAPDAPAVAGSGPTALFGVSWGDPPQKGMVLDEDQPVPGTQFYTRSTDVLMLDDVPLEYILYAYEDGRLAGLSIQAPVSRFDALTKVLDHRWAGHTKREDGARLWETRALNAVLLKLPAPDEASCNLNVFGKPDVLEQVFGK